MPRPRRSATPPRREDLEGFRDGLLALAGSRRREGRPEERAEAALHEGARRVGDGQLGEAEVAFLAAERFLEAQEPEVELIDHPRGLVGYVPLGDRGAPPDRDEEQLSNRLLLVQRLVAVRKSEGADVEGFVGRLNEAESAYVAGDRARARRLVDAVHGDLERRADRSTPSE